MSGCKNFACNESQVDTFFKRSEQFVEQQIADRTYAANRYWVDLYPVKPFPDGVGLTLDKVRFYGDIGPQFDGLEGWRQVQISRPVASALQPENSGCGYKFEEVGHGMETLSYSLFQRDLWTKPICVKDIRTFFQYQQVQDLIFQNLANITMNMREQLNRNAAYRFAIKSVAAPGLPFNTTDPYSLPNVAGADIGKLSVQLLRSAYYPIASEAGAFSIANLNGQPTFGLIAHPETLSDMIYDDPEVRKDIRWDAANVPNLIKRYNFTDQIFGMYMLMPDVEAPRYKPDANGNLIRVFPKIRDIAIEIGTRPAANPEYYTAPYELVLIMTRDLFALRSRSAISSVGGQTNFDAEAAMFNWKWHNPPRCEDPARRTGRYWATGEFGIEPGDFTDITAILVKRRPNANSISFWPNPECPPTPPECSPTGLPDQDCPCPQVVGCPSETALDDELLFFFDREISEEVGDDVNIKLTNGSFITGEITAKNGVKVQIAFDAPIKPEPNVFVSLDCSPQLACKSKVEGMVDCRSAVTNAVTLYLEKAIACTANGSATVKAYFGDGTTALLNVLGWDGPKKALKVRYATGYGPTDDPTGNAPSTDTYDMCCDRKGVKCVCCVPTEDNGCPACDAEGTVCRELCTYTATFELDDATADELDSITIDGGTPTVINLKFSNSAGILAALEALGLEGTWTYEVADGVATIVLTDGLGGQEIEFAATIDSDPAEATAEESDCHHVTGESGGDCGC